jgi:transposase
MITDKGYDCERVREKARSKSMVPIIPRRQNSGKNNPEFDKHLYKLRHLVENLFARLKHMRGIATRYDKLKRNFASSVLIGCVLLWLKL